MRPLGRHRQVPRHRRAGRRLVGLRSVRSPQRPAADDGGVYRPPAGHPARRHVPRAVQPVSAGRLDTHERLSDGRAGRAHVGAVRRVDRTGTAAVLRVRRAAQCGGADAEGGGGGGRSGSGGGSSGDDGDADADDDGCEEG